MNLFFWPFTIKEDDERDYDEIFDEYIKEASKEYFKFRNHYKANNAKFLLKVNREYLGEDDVFENFIEDIKRFSQYSIKPSDIVYSFDNDFCKKTLSKKELENLKKLDEIAKKIGVQVGIYDYKDVFSYKQVANADKKIKEDANKIKAKNFSPIEKLLNAYLNVSKLTYKSEDEQNESASQSRSVYGILNSDKIVCAGFSELLKATVKEFGDPNLKIFANYVGTKYYNNAKLELGAHANNIVYIKDDKYKIDGFYYLDSTWDSVDKGLKYFLTEIGRIEDIYTKIIDFDDALKIYAKRADKEINISKRMKSKSHFTYNYGYTESASVSKDKVKFDDEICYAGKIDKEFADDFLLDYLFSRQDFKDYVILRQTLNDMKYIKQSFDQILEANARDVEKDITQMEILEKPKQMFRFLKQHSPHVDIGPVHNALQTVMTATNPDKSKNEVSKMVYEMLKYNISESKDYYNNENTLWTECEVLK